MYQQYIIFILNIESGGGIIFLYYTRYSVIRQTIFSFRLNMYNLNLFRAKR